MSSILKCRAMYLKIVHTSCCLAVVLTLLAPTVLAQGNSFASASAAGAPAPHSSSAQQDEPVGEAAAASAARIAAGQPTNMLVTIRTTSEDLAAATASLAALAIGDTASVTAPASLRARSDVKRRVAGRVGVEFVRELDQLPVAVVKVSSAAALEALRASPEVVAVEPDYIERTMLNESLPLVSQPAAAARGFLGEGCVVGVLDTGVDYLKPDFGRCPAVIDANGTGAGGGDCSVVFAKDYTRKDDGKLDVKPFHGTNVAAIVLGVAPKAKILSMDVFQGSGASSSNILDAINDAIKFKRSGRFNVCSINLSLGGSFSSANPCYIQAAYEAAFAEAVSVGILPAVAAGNEAYTNRIARPGCCPSAVSVGAVYDSGLGNQDWGDCRDYETFADKPTAFSNSAYYLQLLAPGSRIVAAGIKMSGTSQAAPHVAGAIAVLAAAVPSASADLVLRALKLSGSPVLDGRNGITTPRINVNAGVMRLQELLTPPLDKEPPTGSLDINRGAAVTFSRAVNLFITASDPSGVSLMCVSNSATTPDQCTDWVQFAEVVPGWLLADGPDGQRTVYVYLADFPSNFMTVPLTYTIKLVTTVLPSSVMVNGESGYASSVFLRLRVQAQDAAATTEMCVTDNGADSSVCLSGQQPAGTPYWRSYPLAGTAFSWPLLDAASDKNHTLRVFFKDQARPSLQWYPAEAPFVIDTTRPSVDKSSVNLRPSTTTQTSVTVAFNASADDSVSGVWYYVVAWKPGGRPPITCIIVEDPKYTRYNAKLRPSGKGPTDVMYFTVTGLKPNKAVSCRLCAVDKAGNVGVGPTRSGIVSSPKV